MTYKLRVSLPNIKGFTRVYLLDETNTLYAFHKQMTTDMSFPRDQTVLFKCFDDAESLIARYASFDLGQGSIENISIRKVVKEGITHFTYFYDTINKRSVIITIEGTDATKTARPLLIEEKGPEPEAFLNGYVSAEDIPADKRKPVAEEDFDEDEDEDGDDDGEEEMEDEDEDEAVGEDEDQEGF